MFKNFLIFEGIVICLLSVDQSRVFADEVVDDTVKYNFNEVEIWGEKFPSCKGKRQSPIDISDDKSQNALDKAVEFNNYDQTAKKATLSNNGDFLMLKMEFEKKPSVTITPSNKTFVLDCIVFHWGSDPAYGSDHSLNGNKAAAELQTYHYNTDYSSYDEATKQELGTLAFAYLFEIIESSEGDMKKVEKFLPNVTEIGSKVEIPKDDLFSLEKFVLNNVYYSYNGSVTLPPCTEGLVWILDSEMKSINANQINGLRNIKLRDGAKMNVRPIQPQNGRSILRMKM